MRRARRPPAVVGTVSNALALVLVALAPVSAAAMAGREGDEIASGPGSFVRDGGRVLVDVRFERGALAGLGDLRATGARIVAASRRYQTVTVASRQADLAEVESVRHVRGITEVLAPISRAADCGGAVRSEGDAHLGAATARSAFGLDGSGVTVGILSDSFNRRASAPTHAAGDVASGDLPGPGSPCGSQSPVAVLDDSVPSGSDEGRAMAQVVHDLAPGASLAFATAFKGQFAFANSIRALHNAGARVIVDDVFYPDEPFFQDGPVAVAVSEVTAAGSAYFSAAGNDNLIDAEGHDIASWEAPAFRDSGGCPVHLKAATEAEHCMDFDPSEAGKDDTFGITVLRGATLAVDLQWAEPWFGVKTDLDVFLLDASGKPVEVEEEGGEKLLVGSADDNVAETQEPLEFFKWRNETGESVDVQLAIDRCAEACNPDASATETARLKVALIQNGGGVTATEYPESAAEDVVGPTIFGHAGAPAAVTVGAVRFDTTSTPEPFSSRGPLAHYFGPVKGTDPAPAIAPKAIAKPDLAATDGGANTFFGTFTGVWRFFGTSAAAPHAAAVAALMKQANPSLSPTALRDTLASTARPVGAFGPNAVGKGLVDAYGAVSSIALAPVISITERPPPLGRDRQPRIGFTANRPVNFSCSIDGGALQPCSSPFIPTAPLADGNHGFAVRGVDAAGRAGTSETVSFRIDTRRPNTRFLRRPPKTLRTRHRRARAIFRFGSNERDVTFICKVDAGLLRFCNPRLARSFRLGKHVVWVKARDAAGNVDRSAAIFRFQVKRLP